MKMNRPPRRLPLVAALAATLLAAPANHFEDARCIVSAAIAILAQGEITSWVSASVER